MVQLLQEGSQTNVPTEQWYVESEAEIEKIKNAPTGSTVMILTEKGLKIKMLHSSGKWIDV